MNGPQLMRSSGSQTGSRGIRSSSAILSPNRNRVNEPSTPLLRMARSRLPPSPSNRSASAAPSGVAAMIGSSTCAACESASGHELGMYSSRMPSMCAATCQVCRNASDSCAGMGTFQAVRCFMTVVGRLCQVTIMSFWLIGICSCAELTQCGDCGSRWRTAACTKRVLTQVTTISPSGA
ncbi:Uncharacterised protein [Mycobacteroides abscessus subsp. abscessus]|nr:Uncharacterised protein [Mycobacteroides abscessus subsp. abscessus]